MNKTTLFAAAITLFAASSALQAATPTEFRAALEWHMEANMGISAPAVKYDIVEVRADSLGASFEAHDAYGNVLNFNCVDNGDIVCYNETAEAAPIQDPTIGAPGK